MEVKTEDFLAHYGVLGMKWGVNRTDKQIRNFKSPNLSKLQRSAAKKHLNPSRLKILDATITEERWATGMSQTTYKSLSSKTSTLKKGSNFYRVQLAKFHNKPVSETSYFSKNEEDRNRYRAIIPDLGLQGSKKKFKNYDELHFKSIKDLKSPSEKAQVDAYIDLLGDKAIQLARGKSVTGYQYLKRTGMISNFARTPTDMTKTGLKNWYDFLNDQGAASPMNTAYFKKLKDQGYGVIADLNDSERVSNTPVIILSTSSSLKKINTKELTNQDIHAAQLKFKVAKALDK